MSKNEILKIYENEKALQKGHFILSSGKHSSVYLQSAIVLSNPENLKKIASKMVLEIKRIIKVDSIDIVVSPAMGGVIIGSKVGELLNKKSIFLERVNGQFTLRRGFEIKRNQKVLLIEDVLTTGKSSHESVSCVKAYGADVICLCSIINRSSKKLEFNFPITSLLKVDAPFYDKNNIPLKLQSIPAIKPGSRFIK